MIGRNIKTLFLSLPTILSLFSFLPCIQARNASVIDTNNCCSTPLEATAFALIYALPLVQFINQTSAVFRVVGGPNKINAQSNIASLNSAAVVKPNVDTLYSRVVIDLSEHDLELSVPNITDRFWVYPFYDVFGNDFANLSPVNGSQAQGGLYLLRRADDAYVKPGLELIDSSTNPYSKYKGIVNYPTTYGTLLLRLLLKYNTTENLEAVHRYQNQTVLTPVSRVVSQPGTPKVPPITRALVNGSLTGNHPEQLLQILGRIASYNQPANLSERFRVANILGQAGIVNGRYVRPTGVNVTQAYAIANATIASVVADPVTINRLGNDWQLALPAYEGDFGVNYAHRTYIARAGYQQLVPWITLYPGYKSGSFTNYALAVNQSFLYTFSRKPPVKADIGGFWSLTFYGPDQYLIPNPLNRFEVGDRSNITYQDGSYVYGDDAKNTTTEPFSILVQAADQPPPQNWTANWLPSVAGGGNGSFILRWYVPSDELTNGAYVYPQVQIISPIR